MNSDRHFKNPDDAAACAGKCKHCGKPMKRWWKYKYGSNACRQAAYRKRLAAFVPPIGEAARAGHYGHKRNRRQGETTPPLVAKTAGLPFLINGKRQPGRTKGGAA